MKNPMTPAGIEPATFRFVAQHLHHCATAVPNVWQWFMKLLRILTRHVFVISPRVQKNEKGHLTPVHTNKTKRRRRGKAPVILQWANVQLHSLAALPRRTGRGTLRTGGCRGLHSAS